MARNESLKRVMDRITEDVDTVRKQAKSEKPTQWPRQVVDDGTGGTFLLTFIGASHENETLYASVSVSKNSGITWRRLVKQFNHVNERIFVKVTPNESGETFSYEPFTVSQDEDHKALFESLPPAILSDTS